MQFCLMKRRVEEIGPGNTRTVALGENRTGERLQALSLILLSCNYLLYHCFGLTALKMPVRMVCLCFLLMALLLEGRRARILPGAILQMSFCVALLIFGSFEVVNWLFILLFCVSHYRCEERKLLKALTVASTVCVVLYVLLRAFGTIEPVWYIGADGRVRNTLGFDNVNAAALFFFSWALILFHREHSRSVYALVSLVLVWCIGQTKTRAVLLAFGIYVVLRGLLGALSRPGRERMWVAVSLLLLMGEIGVAVLPFFYPLLAKVFPMLDTFLSGRLSAGAAALQSLSLQNWLMGGGTVETDNFILVMLSACGVVPVSAACLTVIEGTRRLLARRKAKTCALLISLWLVGAVESFLFRAELLITLLFWFLMFRIFGQKIGVEVQRKYEK